MRKFILYRFASLFIVLVLLSVLLFGLVQLSPIDPAVIALGDNATPEQIEALTKEWGLDQPVFVQYVNWATAALEGDLGKSLIGGDEVTHAILKRMPISVSLWGVAIFLAVFGGLGLGLFAGIRSGSLADRIVTIGASIGLALPGFWVGLLVANAFAVQLRWFPVIGYTPITESLTGWLHSLILPCTALSLHAIAVIARQARGTVIEAFDAPYVQALRANGAPDRVIIYRYVIKNALSPVLPIIGIQAGIIVATAVVMERIYAMPGAGALLIDAIVDNDLPMLLGGVMMIACLVLIINLLVDVGLALLDPRVRPS